jgi:hypothetical protein
MSVTTHPFRPRRTPPRPRRRRQSRQRLRSQPARRRCPRPVKKAPARDRPRWKGIEKGTKIKLADGRSVIAANFHSH